jgi:hypothetical protein
MKTNFEIPDSLIRDAVNAAISNEFKKLNIEAIIKSEVEKRIIALSNKGINDGSLIYLIAKKVATEIPVSDIIKILDIDNLNYMVSDRVYKFMLNKMSLMK